MVSSGSLAEGNMTDLRDREAMSSTTGGSSGRNTSPEIPKLEVLSSPPSSSSRIGLSVESRELEDVEGNRKEAGMKSSSSSFAETERLKTELHEISGQAEVSELELQTLRKQMVKETKRGRNLSRRVERLSKEKDALEKELERMKDARIPSREGMDTDQIIEELRLELYHERDVNASLRLQLSKAQESNEELVLEVKDLDEMLKQRDREMLCKVMPIRDEDGDIYSQMEQLALDYEILRQENYELSRRLEQSRLLEQLKMHYDGFSCAPAAYELENQIEALQKELEKKSEELRDITCSKFKQEKRAEQAENHLRKMRSKYANVAAKLQEEFRVLSEQMISTFEENEKAAAKAVTEASRLHSEKCRIEEMLEKANEEMLSLRDSYETKLRENTRISKGNVNCETEEQVDAIKDLENEIDCLGQELSSFSTANNEKDLSIETHRSQLHSSRGKHRTGREGSRKGAAKLKDFVKEIKPNARMAETKRSNRITASGRRTTTVITMKS